MVEITSSNQTEPKLSFILCGCPQVCACVKPFRSFRNRVRAHGHTTVRTRPRTKHALLSLSSKKTPMKGSICSKQRHICLEVVSPFQGPRWQVSLDFPTFSGPGSKQNWCRVFRLKQRQPRSCHVIRLWWRWAPLVFQQQQEAYAWTWEKFVYYYSLVWDICWDRRASYSKEQNSQFRRKTFQWFFSWPECYQWNFKRAALWDWWCPQWAIPPKRWNKQWSSDISSQISLSQKRKPLSHYSKGEVKIVFLGSDWF